MPARRGLCPNFSNCDTADSKETVVVHPGTEFRCPQCNAQLKPVATKFPRWIAIVSVLVFVAAAGMLWRYLHPALQSFTIEPIEFLPGSTTVTDQSKDIIKDALSTLKRRAAYHVVVEAHVAPDDSANDQQFSEERAQEVKQILIRDYQIPEERILAKGLGSTDPPPHISGQTQREWERIARTVSILFIGD